MTSTSASSARHPVGPLARRASALLAALPLALAATAGTAAAPAPGSAAAATTTSSTTTTTAVHVSSSGAVPGDATDDTAAIRAALSAATTRGGAVAFGSGTYLVSGTLTVPDAVRELRLAPDTVLRLTGDPKWGLLTKKGRVGATTMPLTAGGERGSSEVVLGVSAGTDGLAVGSWLFLGSDDSFADHKPMAPGHLRRVTSLTSTADGTGVVVGLDRPLHRALVTNPRAWVARLASPVTVSGGALEHATPLTNDYPLVTLELVDRPVLAGVELRDGGASGVRVTSTVGGHLDVDVHDLLDDHDGTRYGSGRHYGYGVEASGATRDLRVTGTATRVRHAFTTNAAYATVDSDLRGMGDPEHVSVTMDVRETTSTGLDTHEPGWAISFAGSTVTEPGRYRAAGSTDGKEGGGGVFVRARGTRVEGVTVRGAHDAAVTVSGAAPGAPAWAPDEWPVVRDTAVLDGHGTAAVSLYQPARLGTDLLISSHQKVGVRVDDAARGSVLDGVTIDLHGYAGGIGVLGAEHAVLGAVTTTGVARSTY